MDTFLNSGTLGFRSPPWVEKDNIMRLTFPGITHAKKNEGVKLNIEGVNDGVKEELILYYSEDRYYSTDICSTFIYSKEEQATINTFSIKINFLISSIQFM